MNLAFTLQAVARSQPNAAAIIERDRITTFADLENRSCRAARLLTDAGLQPGDAVLVFYPMSAELYIILLALFRLRLVAMFLDPSAGRQHIERCCELHRPQAFIAGTKAHLLRLISPALRRIPVKFVLGFILPTPVLMQMQKYRAASSVASPAFFECLARCCADKGLTLPDVKKLFTGGAPVFPRLLEQMQTMAPNADVVALYGSTEAEP